jgi:hypothetical protein
MIFVPGRNPPSVEQNWSKIVPVGRLVNRESSIFKSSNLVNVTSTGAQGLEIEPDVEVP